MKPLRRLCDRGRTAARWTAAMITSLRVARWRPLTRLHLVLALLVFVGTAVLDHQGFIPHRPEVLAGLAVVAFVVGWTVSWAGWGRRE